jgi:O-antigen ligase
MNRARALDGVALAGLVLYSATAGVSIAASQIGFSLALAASLASLLVARRSYEPNGLEPWFLAYLLAELVSFAFSTNRPENLSVMRRMLLPPMIWLVADRVRSPRDVAWLLVPAIGVIDLLAVWGILQYLGSAGGLAHRVRLLQHVLTTSGIFMMIGLIALGLLLTARSRPLRAGAIVSFLLIQAVLVFTYSRSAWIGDVAGVILLLALWKPRTLIAVPVVGLAIFAASPAPIRDRLFSVFDPSHPLNVERVHMWRAGLGMIRDHPWTGVGDIGLGAFYSHYAPPGTREMVTHLHDNLLMLAVTLGIPGALIVIGLFVGVLRIARRGVRALAPEGGPLYGIELGAIAAVVAFLVMGIFEWNFGDAEPVMMLWFIVGLSIAVGRIGRAGERAA